MSLYEYNYTKVVVIDRLSKEIRDSDITIALDNVTSNGMNVSVFFKEDLPDTDLTILDAIIDSHVPTPLPSEAINVEVKSGVQIHGLVDMTGRSMYRTSFLYDPVANQDKRFSESFNEVLALQGGEYHIIGQPSWGDYLEMMVTDEDNVLGYGAGFVLKKFIEKEYVYEGCKLENFFAPDASEVPPYFYVSLRYVSTGGYVPKIIVRYNFRRVPAQ